MTDLSGCRSRRGCEVLLSSFFFFRSSDVPQPAAMATASRTRNPLNTRTRLFIVAGSKRINQSSKATMGQQSNKVQKRKRRLAYNKRKKTAAKAKKGKKA